MRECTWKSPIPYMRFPHGLMTAQYVADAAVTLWRTPRTSYKTVMVKVKDKKIEHKPGFIITIFVMICDNGNIAIGWAVNILATCSICLSACQCVYPSIDPSVRLSLPPTIYPSNHLCPLTMPHCAAHWRKVCACRSSPTAEMNSGAQPRRVRPSAMFLPTPPRDWRTLPPYVPPFS